MAGYKNSFWRQDVKFFLKPYPKLSQGFGPLKSLMDLDLRAQIQILCLNGLKQLGFGFGPNPSRISKA
jgi:hypothetical protein